MEMHKILWYSLMQKHLPKEFKGEVLYWSNYNVTGRTFLTLIWDKETRKLDVKVAGAKWIFPLHALQKTKTQEQMLANLKHSVAMQALNMGGVSSSQQIATVYGEVLPRVWSMRI